MLTSEHTILDFDGGLAVPDRLTQKRHGQYLAYAQRLLDLYASGVGRTRRELHRAVEATFAVEPDCPHRRIAAFCKLLDNASEFDTDERGRAAELRLKVFSIAAGYHPLVAEADRIFETPVFEVRRRIAAELGQPWDQIEAELYADIMECQRLRSFAGFEGPSVLLSRYNVAQVQASLYRATRLVIVARDDFKTIIQYAKLARLLHEIHPLRAGEYRIELSGPSAALRETRRYGVNFARFIPALLACRDWKLRAELVTPWGTRARMELSSDSGLRSHLPPPAEFDSSVEEAFARKFGQERDGWRLSRETAILHDRQAVFLPDFVFTRGDGTQIHLEIVGFWTPEYLEKKRQVLRQFRHHRILIAVAEEFVREGAILGPDVIAYKTALKVEPVLEALARMAPAR